MDVPSFEEFKLLRYPTPNFTLLFAGVKFLPVIVTCVPTIPEDGEREVMAGA
jgi:hypothetical protein